MISTVGRKSAIVVSGLLGVLALVPETTVKLLFHGTNICLSMAKLVLEQKCRQDGENFEWVSKMQFYDLFLLK